MQLVSRRPPAPAPALAPRTLLMPLPSKDICLKITKSKMQLIILICMCLQEWCERLHKMEESLWQWEPNQHQLKCAIPTSRHDLICKTTTDEEFWRRMASKVVQTTHNVTKGYIVTSSIIKDILEEYSIQGKDQCVVLSDTRYIWHIQTQIRSWSGSYSFRVEQK